MRQLIFTISLRFKEDLKVKEMLREGRAIGCFYVESPANAHATQEIKGR